MVSLTEGKNSGNSDVAVIKNAATSHQVSDEKVVLAGVPVVLHENAIDAALPDESQAIIVFKPDAGTHADVELVAGQKYVFTFPQIAVDAFAQDAKDLMINFSDGSSITLKNFDMVITADHAAVLSFEDNAADGIIAGLIKVVQLDVVSDEDDLASKAKTGLRDHWHDAVNAEQVSKVEPAAGSEVDASAAKAVDPNAAEKAAAIEPAAGSQEHGGSLGSASGGGYGFQSTFEASYVKSLKDVGPIDPTSLRYNFQAAAEHHAFDLVKAESLIEDTTSPQSVLVVGQNVHDNEESSTPHLVGGGKGVIAGHDGPDILVGDAGGSSVTHQTQDYNFVFVLDVSGSMAYTAGSGVKIDLLKDAVKSFLADMSTYPDGEIKVHFVPFSTTAQAEGTFTLTDAGSLTAINAYIDALRANGYTNYESPMQAAISWLESGEPIGGNAITSTYFISDGAPNRFINSVGGVGTANASGALAEVLGSDGTNEASILHGLNDNFIAVGVNIGAAISRLDAIDPTHHALNIADPADLQFALAGTSPIKTLAAAGDDVLEGSAGHDIIFGDILFTDTLAGAHGLTSIGGAGWGVFERLENGQSASNPTWSRDDTIGYILSHAAELGAESLDSLGHGRSGGNDFIHGGAGDDLILGQEGRDVIIGGAGHDTIYGGSGADLFVYQSISEGVDTVKDFHVSEGDRIDFSSILTAFDPLADDISHFVIATEHAGSTTISVDLTGASGAFGMFDLVTLDSVIGLDLHTAIKTGVV